MDVRCGECKKLFRVSDDKITGTGIKFLCTRCGAYVRITRADFEQYILSRDVVPVLDLFETKHGPAAALLSPEAAGPAAGERVSPEQSSMILDRAAPSEFEDAGEEKAPLFIEPDHPAAAPTLEPAAEIKTGPLLLEKPKAESSAEPQPEQHPELDPSGLSVSLAPLPGTSTEPSLAGTEAVCPAEPPVSPVTERIVKVPVPAPAPSRSGRPLVVLLTALIIAGLAVYGIVAYFQSSPHPGKEPPQEIISIEGLQIASQAGTLEANGDLLITGVIENATAKEKTSWYVVSVVNDAQGSELAKIGLLNGKQIFTARDYEVLAGRGVNVQELKAKNLQEKGVVIPPMGSVKFAARYLQPPAGIASFYSQVLPFDPMQLNKEIAKESK